MIFLLINTIPSILLSVFLFIMQPLGNKVALFVPSAHFRWGYFSTMRESAALQGASDVVVLCGGGLARHVHWNWSILQKYWMEKIRHELRTQKIVLLKGHEITWKLNYEKGWDDSRAGGQLCLWFSLLLIWKKSPFIWDEIC